MALVLLLHLGAGIAGRAPGFCACPAGAATAAPPPACCSAGQGAQEPGAPEAPGPCADCLLLPAAHGAVVPSGLAPSQGGTPLRSAAEPVARIVWPMPRHRPPGGGRGHPPDPTPRHVRTVILIC